MKVCVKCNLIYCYGVLPLARIKLVAALLLSRPTLNPLSYQDSLTEEVLIQDSTINDF